MIRYAFFLLIYCIASCGHRYEKKLPYYNSSDFTPNFFQELPDSFHKIPDFSLINQLGDSVNAESVKDKIYVVNYFFTSCPGICPRMMKNLKMIQDSFRNDENLKILSHSVTPNLDDISTLHFYAQSLGVDSNQWYLLTGKKDVIYALGRNSYFMEEDLGEKKDTSDFLHSENVVLIDKKRYIRGVYNGLNPASLSQLILDIRELKRED